MATDFRPSRGNFDKANFNILFKRSVILLLQNTYPNFASAGPTQYPGKKKPITVSNFPLFFRGKNL